MKCGRLFGPVTKTPDQKGARQRIDQHSQLKKRPTFLRTAQGEGGCVFDEIQNLVEPTERRHRDVRAGPQAEQDSEASRREERMTLTRAETTLYI